MASTEEIREGERAQEASEPAAKRFELVTLATQDAVFDWDFVAHEVWRNENCQRLLGAPERSSDSNNSWADRLHPEDRKRVLAARDAALENEDRLFLAEYRLRRPDGSYGNIVERSLIVRDPTGQVVRMVGVLIDITEHKQANEALQEYEKVVEATQTMIAVVDRDYRYLLTNRAFLEHHKLRREQVVGRSVSELLGKEDFEGIIKKNLDACFQGKAIQYEMKHTYPNLGERNLLVSYIPIKGPAGIDRVGSAIYDITEQRRVEEALKASEQRYRDLFENATDIVFTTDMQGDITAVNKAGEQSSGYTCEELTRMSVLQILAPEYVEEGRRVLESLAAGRELGIGEWEIVAKDGRRVRLEASLRLVRRNGEPSEVQGIARDITERKRAEEVLLESQALLNSIVNSTSELIWSVDAKSLGLLSFNQGFVDFFLQRFGVRTKEGMLPEDLLPTDDLKKQWHELYQRALREASYTIEYDMKTVPRTLQLSFNVLRRAGVVFGVSVFAKDITERRRVEEALSESEARFRSLFDSVTVGIYRTAPDGRILMANPALVRMLGFNSFQELATRNLELEGFAPGHPRAAFREQVEREGEVKGFESSWERRDGTAVFVRESARTVRAGDGRVLYYDGIVEDVTERKRAEEALRESEARFKVVFENAAIGIDVVDMQGYLVESNPALQKMLGYNKTELAQMAFTEFAHPGNVQGSWDVFEELAEGKRDRYQVEKRYCRKNGEVIWGQLTVSLVRNQNGEPHYAIGMIEDITERKRVEEALRESEARFRAVFENAAIGIALVDMRGYPVESNPALQKMLGYSARELAQMPFTEYTHPADLQADWDLFTELVEGKRDQYQLEKRFCRKDGKVVWGQLTASLVRNQSGEPEYAIKMIEDISERKRAEEALRELSARLLRLQDKERRRIARELHDTTAQSLAALAMNLSVVQDAACDLSPRARACLSESVELAEECSREIRTLSYLLHPPLLDEVGLGPALRWFVDGYTQRTGIHVELEMPPNFARLPVDIELALYRIVQEGLTNIHLHSGSNAAHICLHCRQDQAVLTVADEGHGMPRGVAERGGRQGAKLGVGIPGMRERIRQLGGQFEINTGNNGTTLTATVPLKENRA